MLALCYLVTYPGEPNAPLCAAVVVNVNKYRLHDLPTHVDLGPSISANVNIGTSN